jgi:hypothetical protein
VYKLFLIAGTLLVSSASIRAAEYCTFVITSDSKDGMLVVTGNFDCSWGYDTFDGPNKPRRYKIVELRETTHTERATKAFGPNTGTAVFILVMVDNGQRTNQRFHLRYTSSSNNNRAVSHRDANIKLKDDVLADVNEVHY